MRCDEFADLIDAFAEDALDEAERAPVAAHVAACETCRLAVAASQRLSASLASLPESAPSAAADARALAAVEEEREWARWRARTRRVVVGAGTAAAALAILGTVFVATPATMWFADHVPALLRVGESWLRLRAAPAIEESRGTLVAALVVLVVVAALDRGIARWTPASQRAR
jgi:anti-sigma factor RsiW